VEKIVYGTIGDQITPEYVKDVNNLEKKRCEVLKEAKRVEKMGKKLDGDIAQAQDALKRARNMEKKYVTLIQQQVEEGGDPQLIQNLEFTIPIAEMLAKMYIKNPPYVDQNCDEVKATPIENIIAAKELLENNRTPAALDTVVKLMSKALVQQEKATSSRRLASDAALCRSSDATKTQDNSYGKAQTDNESRTEPTEVRRREARNRTDDIPVSSDGKPHGKGPQINPSPPHKNYPTNGKYHQGEATPRHKTDMPPPKYKTFEIPQGGIVIRDNKGRRGRSRDPGRRDEPPRREASRDGRSKQREQDRHDNSAQRSGDRDKDRASRRQGSRRYDENQKDQAPCRAEGSRRSCRDQSKDVESKKRRDPSPSQPSSPHGGGGGGGGPTRSRSSRKDLPQQKAYDARTHLNEIAQSQTTFFLGPKCFGQRIRDEPIPHGFKIEKNIHQYNGLDRPLTWLQDYFNAV
jgi:hypothetical protein